MPELTGEQLAAFTTAFEPLCDALASALSEGVNQLVACDPPAIEQKPLDALMLSVEPVLQTSFSYPGLCPDEALLLFSETDAGVIADLIAGGDGSKPAAPVDDDRIDQIAAAVSGVVEGLGAAIGAAIGAPVEPSPSLATTLAALTLPAAFLAAGAAVEVAVPFRIAGLLDSTLRLLMTPDLALAIVGPANGDAAPDAAETAYAAEASAAPEAEDAGGLPEFPSDAEGDAQADASLDAPFDTAFDAADLPDPMADPDASDSTGGPQPMDLPSFDTPATGAASPDIFGGAAPGGAAGAGGFGGFGSAGGLGGGGAFGGFGMAPAPPGSNPFQSFEATGGAFETMPRGMDLIMDIPLDVTVELGRVQMLIKDVLDLATGSIVELERVAGEPIDLLVNGQLIAKGEVVVIEDNFGIRITEIVSPSDRLNSVGKRG